MTTKIILPIVAVDTNKVIGTCIEYRLFGLLNLNKSMTTKTILPIIAVDTNKVIGTCIEYRLFGLLICRKTMFTPALYGIEEYEFTHRI